MQVLSYSPSIEAYVETRTSSGGVKHYDLSPDITSLNVVRQSMGSSNFTLKIQNKNFKYNGVFTPMDKIVLYATKTKRVKLFSGFITDCDVFSIYQGDMTLKGRCTLYRIEQYYWDPGLYASMKMLWNTRNTNDEWVGYAQTISDLLTNVAGWPSSRIYIGEVPGEAQDYAKEMYLAGQESSTVLKERIDEFYEILRTHGPKLAAGADGGGTLGSGDGMGVWNLYISWEGKFTYSQGPERLNLPESGAGDCSSSIYCAYQKAAGVDCGTWTGDMITKGELVEKGSGNLPTDKMAVADLIIVNHSAYNASYDHVELYGPNDQYAGHGGPGKGPTIKNGAKAYGSTQHDWQVRRYLFGSSDGDSGGSGGSGPSGGSISFSDFMSRGVVQGSGETAGYKFTYYSETVLSGGGLNIPGRHVAGGSGGNGYVCDGSGNIVLARPAGGKWKNGDTVNTPFGKGKFYDYCPEGNIDVYVHYSG